MDKKIKNDLSAVSGGIKPSFDISFAANSKITSNEGMFFIDNSQSEIDNEIHKVKVTDNYLNY